MARVTNAFLPANIRDERDIPAGVQGNTRFYTKKGVAEVDARYQSNETAFPYSDYTTKWDPDKYIPPQNQFGYRSGEDPSPGVQSFAPAGMFGQVHAGKAKGNEMSTLLVRKQFNHAL